MKCRYIYLYSPADSKGRSYYGDFISLDIPAKGEQKRIKNRKLDPDLIPGLINMLNSIDEADIEMAWKIVFHHKIDKTFHRLIDELVEDRISNNSLLPLNYGKDQKWYKIKRRYIDRFDRYANDEDKHYGNKYRIVKEII